MSLAQVTTAANQIDKERIGYQAISLTNFASNTLEPQIAAGSKIEIGGALFEAAAAESGTGWAGIANSNQVYFYLTVTGATAAFSYSTTAPTWDTAKQGWYNAALRCFGGCYKDSGGNYSLKWLYDEHDQVGSIKRYGDGTIGIPSITNAQLAANAVSVAKINLTLNAGSQVIAAGSSWTVPAGIYMTSWVGVSAAPGLVSVDGHDSNVVNWPGGMIISDGVNVVLKNVSGAFAATVYYRKLA